MSRDCQYNLNVPSGRVPWTLLLLALMLSLVISAPAFAKGGDPVWLIPATQGAVVDARAGIQYAKAMAVDLDGNIIIVGSTNTGNNNYQVVKIKADGSGTAAWSPVSSGGSGDDVATAVAVDSARNIIVTGSVWNPATLNFNIRTIKYDQNGVKLWEHDYDAAGGEDRASGVAVDTAGNIYVAGYGSFGTRKEDFLLIKYGPDGPVGNDPAWVEIFDDTAYPNNNNRFTAIAAGVDGIAVTGYSSKGESDSDIFTRKYGFDKSLVREWRHSSPGSTDDHGVAVKIDAVGNVIITGSVIDAANNKDIYIAKYYLVGNEPDWYDSYDGNGEDDPKGLWVDKDSGDVYVTGTTATLAGNTDFYTVRYSSSGHKEWESIFDTGNGAADIPVAIVADNAADGGVFVTGYTTVSSNEDYLTLKFRKDNGYLLWQKTLNGSASQDDRPVGIALIPDEGLSPRDVIVAGWSHSGSTHLQDFTAIKYDFGALNAPTRLTATVATNSSITLTWSDNSINEEKFVIQRKLGETGNWADLPEVASPVPPNSAATVPYLDSNLESNKYYYYRVRASNTANGDSHYSNEAHALTKVVAYVPPAWSFRYDGTWGDYPTAIITAPDNNPVVTGYSRLLEEGTSEDPTDDYVTFKLDRINNSVKWQALYDSGSGGNDWAAGLALDSSGDLLVTGTASLQNGEERSDDLYTAKFRTSTVTNPATKPDFMWGFPYGTVDSIDMATAIAMRQDGSNSSVIIGYGQNSSLNDDVFIIKLNNDGTPSWTQVAVVFDSGRHDHPSAVAFDSAGNIFVAGYSFDINDTITNPTGSYDWFIHKYSGATGALIWPDTFDGGVGDDQALALDIDAAGNAYVSGYVMLPGGKTAFHTVKYRSAPKLEGEEQWIWRKSFSYPGFDAEAIAVKVDPIDNAVVVAGNASVSASDSDFHLIRYNSADGTLTAGGGKPFWEIHFDLPATYDYVTAMTLDPSGYIYLAGNTRSGPESDPAFDSTSDIMALIYDYEGRFLEATNYDSASKEDEATAIAVNNVGEAFIAGSSVNASDNADYLVLKQVNSGLLVPDPFTVTAQIDSSKVNLAWQHNNSSATFIIERTPGPATPLSEWTVVATPGAGSVSFTDTLLAAETSYCYRINAVYDTASSRKTMPKCVTTRISPPTLAPLVLDPDHLNPKITLNWSQVTNNAGYKIERKIGTGPWSDLITKPTDQNSHEDTGLAKGTTYSYQVTTLNAAGNSIPSTAQTKITMPAAPTLAAPYDITNCRMSLSWNPGVTGADSYTLYKKLAGGSYDPVPGCEGIGATSCPATDLTTLSQYVFQVKARNASGESAGSNEQIGIPILNKPTLKAPTSITNNSMYLAWDPGVYGATSYTLEYRDVTAGGSWGPSGCPINLNLYCTVSLPQPNHVYAFRVRADNPPCGNSEWSSEQTGTAVLATPAFDTGRPSNITKNSMYLSWSAVSGAGVTSYPLQYREGTTGEWTDSSCPADTSLNCTVNLPKPDTTYYFHVKARNASGDSLNWSSEKNGKTLLPEPNLESVSGTSTTNIDIAWTDNSLTENNYVIERSPCADSNNNSAGCATGSGYTGTWSVITNGNRPANSTTWSDNTVVAGTQYKYRVKATTSAGNASIYSSEDRYASTFLAQPVMASVVPVSTTSFDITWSDITGETSYTLERKEGVAGTYAPVPGATGLAKNTITYRDEGLNLSTEYCYRVQASTSFGVQSVYSSNEKCRTTPLSAPILNGPIVASTTEIDLSWNKILASDSYEMERCPSTDHQNPTARTASASCSVFTPSPLTENLDIIYFNSTGLAVGNTYRYRVRSWYNSSTEYTGWSTEQWATTKTATPVLNTPSPASSTQLNLSWGDVVGDNGYNLYWKVRSGANCSDDSWSGPIPLSLNATSFSHSPLSSGTYYCYKIKTIAPPGSVDSDFSAIVSQMTYPAAPVQPTFSNISASSVTVSWSPNVTGNTGYKIERNYGIVDTVGPNQTTYLDNNLSSGTLYTYRISATSPVGDSSFSLQSSVTTTPAIPIISGTVISEDEIDICWPLVFGATSYKVVKTGTPPIPDQTVSYGTSYCGAPYPTVSCPSLTANIYCLKDTGLTKDTTYSYHILSANGTDSPASNEVTLTTLNVGNQILTATPLSGGFTIRLDWTPVACSPDPCDNPDSFEIQVQVREGVWVNLAMVSGSRSTYTDNIAIDPNKSYRYRIRSIKGDNKSPFSAVAEAVAKQYTTGANVCR